MKIFIFWPFDHQRSHSEGEEIVESEGQAASRRTGEPPLRLIHQLQLDSSAPIHWREDQPHSAGQTSASSQMMSHHVTPPKRTFRASSASLPMSHSHASQSTFGFVQPDSPSSSSASSMYIHGPRSSTASLNASSPPFLPSLAPFLRSPILRRPLLLIFVMLFILSLILAYIRIASIPTEQQFRGGLYSTDPSAYEGILPRDLLFVFR